MIDRAKAALEMMQSVASLIGNEDRARYAEIVAFMANPARLSFDADEAKRYTVQAADARHDLLAILRRAEAGGDVRIANLIRYFEGRE